MSIELNPQGLARYEHLFNHPIYYYHALQYMKGSFFRAVLGYETIWDKDYENSLVRQLDHTLHFHMERKEYFFESIIFTKQTKVFGTLWVRGVKTGFEMLHQKRKDIAIGQRALARINLLDKPNHVDLDFDDGSVWTIPYVRYLRYKQERYAKVNHANPTKPQSEQTSTHPKDAKPNAFRSPQSFSEEISSRDLPANVFSLQKRQRRPSPLSKTHAKVR